MKEGIYTDHEKKDKLAALARYKTTRSEGKWVSLDDYVKQMPEEQKEIYQEAVDILYAGFSAIKAGKTALDVIEKWPSDPRRLGSDNWDEIDYLLCFHGIGMGMGRGDYARRAHPGTPKGKLAEIKLEENMTLAVENWNGRPGGENGVFLEEDVIVTKDGYERLARFPFDVLTECGT